MNVWPNTKSTSSSALYPNLSSGRTELCPEAEQQRQTGGWRQEAAGHQEGGRTGMRMAATGREVKTRLQQSRNMWIRERRRGGGASGGGRDGGSDVLRAAVEIRANGADGGATARTGEDGADGLRATGADGWQRAGGQGPRARRRRAGGARTGERTGCRGGP